MLGEPKPHRPIRLAKERETVLASLFGAHRLREVASQLETDPLLPKIEIVQRWLDDLLRGTLRTDNETGREQQFNLDFFKTILGYVERPVQPHTFQPKSSTESGEIPDARIGLFDSSAEIDETVAVVELKGASINLDQAVPLSGQPWQRGLFGQPPLHDDPRSAGWHPPGTPRNTGALFGGNRIDRGPSGRY